MGGYQRHGGTDPRGSRRWVFADCIFDEADWTLRVSGTRVAAETKPLELLRILLINAGHLVSKAALMDAVWPNVAVVEASLPTAMRKLRLALGDDDRVEHLIETVPRIGYRLMVPATLLDDPFATPGLLTPPTGTSSLRRHRSILLAAGALAGVALLAALLAPSEHVNASKVDHVYSDKEAINALRRLDVAKVDLMIADGWKPAALDHDGNNALNRLLEICEWDPGHDRARMMTIARTLLDAGVDYSRKNIFGDTSYSIAKARRYCGPAHPVTVMLHNLCYARTKAEGDNCLATYEVKRRPA